MISTICRVLAIALAGVLGVPALVEACSCTVSPHTTCGELLKADVLLVATVSRIELEPAPPDPDWPADLGPRLIRRVHLSSIESLHGERVVSVMTFDDECGYTFHVGVRYLIEGWRGRDGAIDVSLCSRTQRESDAAGFIRALRAPHPSGARLFGQVDYPVRWAGTLTETKPLAGARVHVDGPVSRQVTTDRNGRYEFEGLPVGDYGVRVSLPTAMTHLASPDRDTVTVYDGAVCVEAGFRARSRGVVAGRAVDENGSPLAGVFIELAVTERLDGEIGSAGLGITTGPDGRFVFDDLPPGRYMVGTNVWDSAPSRISPYPRTPAFTSSGEKVISLQPGAEVNLPPLRLRRLTEVTVTGTVRVPAGVDVAKQEVRAYITSSDGREFPSELAFVDADRKFLLRLWAGEVYRLTIGPRNAPLAEVQFVAGADTLEVVVVRRP